MAATTTFSASHLRHAYGFGKEAAKLIGVFVALTVTGLTLAVFLGWGVTRLLGHDLSGYPWHVVLLVDLGFMVLSAVLAEWAEQQEGRERGRTWVLASFIIAIGTLAPLASHAGKTWRDVYEKPRELQETTLLSEVLSAQYGRGGYEEFYFWIMVGLIAVCCLLAFTAAIMQRRGPALRAGILIFFISTFLFAVYTLINQKWDVTITAALPRIAWTQTVQIVLLAMVATVFLTAAGAWIVSQTSYTAGAARESAVAVRDLSWVGRAAILITGIIGAIFGWVLLMAPTLALLGIIQDALPESTQYGEWLARFLDHLKTSTLVVLGLLAILAAPVAVVLAGLAVFVLWNAALARVFDLWDWFATAIWTWYRSIWPAGSEIPPPPPSNLWNRFATAIRTWFRSSGTSDSTSGPKPTPPPSPPTVKVPEKKADPNPARPVVIEAPTKPRQASWLDLQALKPRLRAIATICFGCGLLALFFAMPLRPDKAGGVKKALESYGSGFSKSSSPPLSFSHAAIDCPDDDPLSWPHGEVDRLQKVSRLQSCTFSAQVPCWAASIIVAGTASPSRDVEAEKQRARERGQRLAQILARGFRNACRNEANLNTYVLNLGPYASGSFENDSLAQRRVYVRAGKGDTHDKEEAIAAAEALVSSEAIFAEYSNCDLYYLDPSGSMSLVRSLNCRTRH